MSYVGDILLIACRVCLRRILTRGMKSRLAARTRSDGAVRGHAALPDSPDGRTVDGARSLLSAMPRGSKLGGRPQQDRHHVMADFMLSVVETDQAPLPTGLPPWRTAYGRVAAHLAMVWADNDYSGDWFCRQCGGHKRSLGGLICGGGALTLDLVMAAECRGGMVAEPVRARRLTGEKGRRRLQIVRRGKHGSVRYVGQ